MKVLKVVFSVIIIYFVITAANSMVAFSKWVSFGVAELEYLVYILLLILFFMYVLIPVLKYYKKPSLEELAFYIKIGKNERKINRYLYKILNDEQLELFESSEDKKIWIVEHLTHKLDEFDRIIKRYAQQATVIVMISPNSFIDGITILFSNSKMIYTLSKKVGFRYNTKELFKMYFSVLTVASISGLVEEFDEVIEEIIQELAEEFSEIIAEETGKSVSKSIPFLNVAVNSLSPILQAAGNYAFMLYSGHRFKYAILNVIENENLSEKEIKRKARKRARNLKYVYIKDMSSRIISGTGRKFSDGVKNMSPFYKSKDN